MEPREEFALLRWLNWAQARNWVRWAVRRPAFWLFVALFAGATIPFAIVATALPPGERIELSFGTARLMLASLLLFASLSAGMFGRFLLFVSRPVADILYPAPVDRARLLQSRVRRALLLLAAGNAGVAAAAGGFVAAIGGPPDPFLGARLFLVLLPATGFWFLLGALAAYGSSRDRWHVSDTIVLAAVVAFFLGMPSLVALDLGGLGDDPVIVAWLSLAVPVTKIVVGSALDLADVLYLAGSWVAFAGLAFTATRWPYVLFEDAGTHTVPVVGPLSQERIPSPGILRDLRIRLRVPYQDLGAGWRGLLGRNVTDLVRGPALLLHLTFAGIFLPVMLPFIVLSSRSSAAWFSILMGGMIVSLVPIFSFAGEGPRNPQVRLLPLTPSEVFLAHSLPAFAPVVAWTALIGAVIATVGADLGTVLFGVGFLASLGALSTSGQFLGSSLGSRRLPLAPHVEDSTTSPGFGFAMMWLPFVALSELIVLLGMDLFSEATVVASMMTAVNFLLVAGLTVAGIDLYRKPPGR